MSDIGQAVKWMKAKNRVRRRSMPWWILFIDPDGDVVSEEEKYTNSLWSADLLADDWEVYE